MKLEMMSIAELVPDPENPRTHDKRNLDAIMASLASHGQVEPIVVQRSSNMVIAGNGRVQAMKRLGWREAKAVIIDVDDNEARALSIRLNRTAELAGWDEKVLAKHVEELSAMSAWDALDFGFNDKELDALMKSVEDIAKVQPAKSEAETMLEHAKAVDMRGSKQREIRLHLSAADEKTVQLQLRVLAKHYNLDNITDTICRAIQNEYDAAS